MIIIASALISVFIGQIILCVSTPILSKYNKPCEDCYETKYYSFTKYSDGTKKEWLILTDTTCGINIIIAQHDEHTKIRKINTNCR